MDKNEASICSLCDLNSFQVSLGNVSYIDKGYTITTDACHFTRHETFYPTESSCSFLAHGWTRNESRTNSHKLKPFVFGKRSLEIPSCLLSYDLALDIEAHAFRSVRITPMTLVVSEISRFVSFSQGLDRSDA